MKTKIEKWLRGDDIEATKDKPKVIFYRISSFYFITVLVLLLLILFGLNAQAKYYEKSDFKTCYQINNKEFKKMLKAGEIQDTVIKWRAEPLRLYEMKKKSKKKYYDINLDYHKITEKWQKKTD